MAKNTVWVSWRRPSWWLSREPYKPIDDTLAECSHWHTNRGPKGGTTSQSRDTACINDTQNNNINFIHSPTTHLRLHLNPSPAPP